jgi:hypothetical protein
MKKNPKSIKLTCKIYSFDCKIVTISLKIKNKMKKIIKLRIKLKLKKYKWKTNINNILGGKVKYFFLKLFLLTCK